MRRVALFGGSFDPPHMGHVLIINAVLNSKLVDEVWLVPTGLRPDKNYQASVADRNSMISIMLATMFGSHVPVILKTTQTEKFWQRSTTYDLKIKMERDHPDCKFSFVIGADLVRDIPQWVNAKELMKKDFFLVVQRLGAEFLEKLPDYAVPVPMSDVALTNISSSLVRKMVASGQSLEGLVPTSVINHIIKNKLYAEPPKSQSKEGLVIAEGKFVRFRSRNGWEYVERNNCTGVVLIAAITKSKKILLTEQFRLPVNKKVIELPAGLVNDHDGGQNETMESAAVRELIEETGYQADKMVRLFQGPVSAGLTSEIVTLFLAEDVEKVAKGGGDTSESIITHEIAVHKVKAWLEQKTEEGFLVDPKIYAALYWIGVNKYGMQ